MSQAYEDLMEPCPHCHAGVAEPCINKLTGKPSHIVCIARLKRVPA